MSGRRIAAFFALALTAMTVASCDRFSTDGDYTYACPPPVTYEGSMYWEVDGATADRAGDALGTGDAQPCTDTKEHAVSVSSIVGVPRATAVLVTDHGHTSVYALEDEVSTLCAGTTVSCPRPTTTP